MTLFDEFRRLRKNERCLVCDHNEWCMVSRDEPPSRVICQRVESPRQWKDAGWLHVLRESDHHHVRRPRKVVVNARGPLRDFGGLAAQHRERADPAAVARLAGHLGVSVLSLERLHIGWDGRNWSFPMTDTTGMVRGIRLRAPDGRKFAVPGSKDGLFTPRGLDGGGPLLIAEGPTDTAAALDLRFDAVGRPSCRGATRLVVEFIKKHNPPTTVVVADADDVGRSGAADLASVLVCYCRSVRVIEPLAKDLRAWLQAGATPAEVNNAIESSTPLRVSVRSRTGRA